MSSGNRGGNDNPSDHRGGRAGRVTGMMHDPTLAGIKDPERRRLRLEDSRLNLWKQILQIQDQVMGIEHENREMEERKMQIVIDENFDEQEWTSNVGEISFETDNGGRLYFSWKSEGITTEIGVNLVDVLKFIQEKMLEE